MCSIYVVPPFHDPPPHTSARASFTLHPRLVQGPLVTGIGKKYKKSGVQVSLRWQVQQGIPVIPKSSNPAHLAENLDMFSWKLSVEDNDALTQAIAPPVCGGGDNKTSGDCAIP